MSERRGPTRDAPRGPPSTRDRRARERRILQLGLALSLAIHVIAIGIAGGLLERPRSPERRPSPEVAVPPSGLRAMRIQEVPEDPLSEPERPRMEPRPDRDPAPTPPRVAATEGERIEVDSLSAADRLRPRVVDPRLWRPVVLVPREPTLAEVQARVAAAVELLSDSALAEAQRAVDATDWTVEDGSGGKWGISPGKLHLGKLTLPLPIAFAVDPGAETEAWMYMEIERQLDRAALLESFEDRVKAIRERREKDRAGGAKAASSGSGS